jgi:hypothetical protein
MHKAAQLITYQDYVIYSFKIQAFFAVTALPIPVSTAIRIAVVARSQAPAAILPVTTPGLSGVGQIAPRPQEP